MLPGTRLRSGNFCDETVGSRADHPLTPMPQFFSLPISFSPPVVTETNDFLWPAPALRSRRQPARFDYGMPPPRFFALSVTGFCRRTRIEAEVWAPRVPRTA